jgi:hypothetical protein
MKPRIHPPFRDLIPPLAGEERTALEADIVAHGCTDPLWVWRGMLIDGHNRLEICERRGLPYSLHDVSGSSLLPDEASVMQWICEHQLARRNLTPWQLSYLRGERLLIERERRARLGQSGPRGDDGRIGARPEPLGEARALVAAEHGVGARTVTRDAAYAMAIRQLTEHCGIEARNAVLRGDVRVTRRAIADVVAKRPKSLDELRACATEFRVSRPTTPRSSPSVVPYFQRGIVEFITTGEGDERRVTHARLAVCSHLVPVTTRSGDVSRRKTMRCPRCCSGSRPAYERERQRALLRKAVQSAMQTPHGLDQVVDLVDAAIGMLAFVPQKEDQFDLIGRIDRAIEQAGIARELAGAPR